ncbi:MULTISPECIES: O-antigen ligase family protein [unclassified Brenneria]|uniref:O-antigen ligase family protein n=1 Tax=unclassified Brenneria TaxID=2634434 RepID=UPI001552EE1F|nr:O-antigen ligase family protein [Brenneria sp. hezel4-2-4]MEE3652211.1 O-antigen ligase family protein [Brenneria sp. HEZEL_4_2_4]NPD02170.1 O-antigen ligase family protein [Brenneria sp. hezel4-2-4]
MKNFELNIRKNLLSTSIYIGFIIALNFMIFNSRLSVKIFNNIGIIAIIFLFLVFKTKEINNKNIMVALSMLLLSAVNFIWGLIYKTDDSEMIGIYHSYHNIEKILLIGSVFIFITVLSPLKYKESKPSIIGIYVTPIILLIYFYFSRYDERFTLSDGIATSSAYMITFIGILISQAIFISNIKIRVNLFLLNYFVFFILIILTGTRAAILAYPLLSIIVLSPFIYKNKKIDFKLIVKFITISIACIALCYDTINTRANNLLTDLKKYEQADSNTSVGARIAMYKAGMSSFLNAPMGQSAESRAIDIEQQAEKDRSLLGASLFTKIHLHNEFIEAISLKGIFGGAALLIFYASLIYFSFFIIRDYAIISLSLALIIYGLSDVIFYGRNTTIVWVLTYCLSIFLAQSQRSEQTSFDKVVLQ